LAAANAIDARGTGFIRVGNMILSEMEYAFVA
jgi:hypothetical protein